MSITIAIASIFRCGFLMFSFWLNIWYIHFLAAILHFAILSLTPTLFLSGCVCALCFCLRSRVYSFYSVAYKMFTNINHSYHISTLFVCLIFPVLFFWMRCFTAAIFRGSHRPFFFLYAVPVITIIFLTYTSSTVPPDEIRWISFSAALGRIIEVKKIKNNNNNKMKKTKKSAII